MSVTPSDAQAASDTLAALERYRVHVTKLAARWMDAELYHTVAMELDRVRHACHALPRLSGAWVALLIAHAELVAGLWQLSNRPAGERKADHQRLLQRLLESADALQDQCMKLVGPAGPA